MKLLKVLANLNRKKILQLCKKKTAVAVLERSLGISHGYLWKNINLLQKNKLIKLYEHLPKDKPKKYIGGRPYFRWIETTISKKHIQEIEKELNWIKKIAK